MLAKHTVRHLVRPVAYATENYSIPNGHFFLSKLAHIPTCICNMSSLHIPGRCSFFFMTLKRIGSSKVDVASESQRERQTEILWSHVKDDGTAREEWQRTKMASSRGSPSPSLPCGAVRMSSFEPCRRRKLTTKMTTAHSDIVWARSCCTLLSTARCHDLENVPHTLCKKNPNS